MLNLSNSQVQKPSFHAHQNWPNYYGNSYVRGQQAYNAQASTYPPPQPTYPPHVGQQPPQANNFNEKFMQLQQLILTQQQSISKLES